MSLLIRDAAEADLGAVTAIYAHAVIHGTATFETEAPDLAEITRRYRAVRALGMPYLVAERPGVGVVGYAYAGQYRPRAAYRFSVEDSIYVAPGQQGHGIGRALLTELIKRCEARDDRLMIAVIGDSTNVASINLHERCGFHQVGVLPAVGWKAGQWLNTVLMVRPLGAGATAGPAPGR